MLSESVRALLNEYYLRESTAAEDHLLGELTPRNISYDATSQTFTDTTTNTTVTGYTAVPNGEPPVLLPTTPSPAVWVLVLNPLP